MDLREYIFYNRLKMKDVASALDCSSAYLSLLKDGKARPSRRLARDIVEFTKGNVTYDYLMSLPTQIHYSKRQTA